MAADHRTRFFDLEPLAETAFKDVFRRSFDRPGFALLPLGRDLSTQELRAAMIDFKDALARCSLRRDRRPLAFRSLARFDQQNTTKFHLDGGPSESYLMLGYEPTQVRSTLAMADYTQAAFRLGIEPAEFLDRHNPMYKAGEDLLRPFVRVLDRFDPSAAQIVLINNSSLPFRADGSHVLGVMHQATIPDPLPNERRIINSTMIVPRDRLDVPEPSPELEALFVSTDRIDGPLAGSGY